MIRQDYIEIELKKGYAFMQINEGDKIVAYTIQLHSDRSKADVSRKIYEFADWGIDEIGKLVLHNEVTVTLEEAKHMQLYGNLFIWLMRGLIGMPHYASKET